MKVIWEGCSQVFLRTSSLTPLPAGGIISVEFTKGEFPVDEKLSEKITYAAENILALSRNSIFLDLRFLENAVCRMTPVPGGRCLGSDGKNIYYSLADDHVRTILAMGREHINE